MNIVFHNIYATGFILTQQRPEQLQIFTVLTFVSVALTKICTNVIHHKSSLSCQKRLMVANR